MRCSSSSRQPAAVGSAVAFDSFGVPKTGHPHQGSRENSPDPIELRHISALPELDWDDILILIFNFCR
jgi:hypothetical protein